MALHIDHVVLWVEDARRAFDFYTKVVGLEGVRGDAVTGQVGLQVVLGDSDAAADFAVSQTPFVELRPQAVDRDAKEVTDLTQGIMSLNPHFRSSEIETKVPPEQTAS